MKKLIAILGLVAVAVVTMAAAPFNLNDTTHWEQFGIITKGDSTGTPGNATLNTGSGRSAFAVGAATVVITNSRATATSHILVTAIDRDTTCVELVNTVNAAGSFTVTCIAAATATTKFHWLLVE
jgi:hypothetical protein